MWRNSCRLLSMSRVLRAPITHCEKYPILESKVKRDISEKSCVKLRLSNSRVLTEGLALFISYVHIIGFVIVILPKKISTSN